MCTAINMHKSSHLFGRTLDLEINLGQEVIQTPKDFPYEGFKTKYSIIGAGIVRDGIPLYFDGMNEQGLCAAALNYPNFAFYRKEKNACLNLPSYALLPYILGNCANLNEARELLYKINITDTPFSPHTPPSPLHWIFADNMGAICAEPERNGLRVHEDIFGVLTNAPSFEHHQLRVCDLSGISPTPPENRLCPNITLNHYTRGLGAISLPGDFSSCSRFIRALFSLTHTKSSENAIGDFFHIMDTVAIPEGTVIAENGSAVRTVYTCCADTDKRIYYFTTYDCRRIRGVRMSKNTNTDLLRFSMDRCEDIEILN